MIPTYFHQRLCHEDNLLVGTWLVNNQEVIHMYVQVNDWNHKVISSVRLAYLLLHTVEMPLFADEMLQFQSQQVIKHFGREQTKSCYCGVACLTRYLTLSGRIVQNGPYH